MPTRVPRSVVQVGPGVTFVEGPVSNWVVLAEEDGVALIDAGYPADSDLVLDTIIMAGHNPEELRRVYVTHGHVDHIGGLPGILRRFPSVEVLAYGAEVANVRGPERNQATFGTFGGRVFAPRVAAWLARAVRSGVLGPVSVRRVRAFTDDDFAGRPIAAIPVPGHTPGSTAYELRGVNAIATGDAVITHHDIQPPWWAPRPRMITPLFTADHAVAVASARALQIPSLVLPGHGPAVRRVGSTWMPLTH